jgi:hypothetical protein
MDHLKVVLGRSGAPLEITFGYCHTLFIRVLDLLIAVVGYQSEVTRMHFCPFFSPLAPFLVLLTVVLVDAI